ncbi:MAG: hypothetical protein ACKVHI_08405 [Candidatus Puniceispirillales bacterium]|jgi:hypothetical protein|nr:hypothetical protein [Alphaproteobacteria bacterium]|tara:strand:+ start:43 stop:249 length:207 start_codon:yes stop_codon:yes gene_type:complete
MKPGDKFYLIENPDIYSIIIDEKIMNNIPHFNLIIYRGQSETKTCLSKIAIETFYQKSPSVKTSFFNS